MKFGYVLTLNVITLKDIIVNRVAGGLNPPAPTTPGLRVRTGRFTESIEP